MVIKYFSGCTWKVHPEYYNLKYYFMKKIFTMILSSLVLMTSCNEEIEENWTVDTLAISCESLEDAGDGNLKMTLPTEFSGKLSLNIESSSPWQAEVGDITIQEEQWMTLSSEEGNGKGTLDINIAPNTSAIDRIGSVVITTSGNIPVKKTVTLIQGNTDDMLSIGFNDIDLPDGVTVEEGLSGSWNMVLPKDFPTSESISVAISSTVEPTIEITYPDGLTQDWLSQTVNVLNSVPEVHVVSFTATENSSNEYREALITFISKSGDVKVEKTLTVFIRKTPDVWLRGFRHFCPQLPTAYWPFCATTRSKPQASIVWLSAAAISWGARWQTFCRKKAGTARLPCATRGPKIWPLSWQRATLSSQPWAKPNLLLPT